jgi:hypothetical protein
MENQIQILIEEIKQIRAQYVAEVGPGGGKAWPRAIKNRVLELDRLLNSTKRRAEVCGISVDTVYQWRSEAKKENFKQLSVVNKKSVTVTDTKSQKLAQISEGSKFITVTVTTPKGFKVEGLTADLALELLLKLGAR